MDLSRREVSALFSAFLPGIPGSATNFVLPSAVFSFDSLPAKVNPKTHAAGRQVLAGTTHEGFPIDLHITTMPPGQMPHPPHHHIHEEMMLVQQGTLEVTIAGKTNVVGPGSVIYVHSNEEHSLKSVGGVAAQYFVLALGQRQSA